MTKIIDYTLVVLFFLLALVGAALITTGIWIGGDWVAKFVWTGIISIALGVLSAVVWAERAP